MNLKKIQNVFLYCFYGNEKVEKLFSDLTSDKNIDFQDITIFLQNIWKIIIKKSRNKL